MGIYKDYSMRVKGMRCARSFCNRVRTRPERWPAIPSTGGWSGERHQRGHV